MKLFRQVILLTLALLLFVSSTGFSVGLHLCAGELNGLSFYGKATECLMEQKKVETLPPCHAPAKEKSTSNNCCEDHQLIVEHFDATTADSKALLLNKTFDLKFIAAVKVVILQFLAPATEQKPAYALYTSPPVTRDLPVLLQTFLI